MLASGEKFEYPPYWGMDLQSEHERFLTERHFKCPVIVYNYPKEIKPFYMRLNDDGKTVTAMDVLVPGIGEIIGGSQREERLDVLEGNIERLGMDAEAYYWYNDLRRYGTVPHAGFGVGFERLIMFVTGVQNIRDVLPYPRTPRNCEF
jgi:asparaginyl-tRNA synthetase